MSESTRTGYAPTPRERGQPLDDHTVIGLTIALTLGTWVARPVPLPVLVLAVGGLLGVVAGRRRTSALVLLGAVLLGSWSGDRAWRAATAGPMAAVEVDGVGTLLSDPAPLGRGRSVVIEIDGRRYEALTFGSPSSRLADLLAGETVHLAGEIGPAPPARARRLAARHIVGRLTLDHVSVTGEGSPAARAANRIRRALARGSAGLPDVERSLFLGLIIGDDREQPRELVDDFRASGLSHLSAVSGQNVAFVLLVAAPALTRLRPRSRWLATTMLIGWFALLTRFEPSVIRASGMAVLSATAFWRGRQASPLRMLALTVAAFHLVDPLLVWSVGWWLSVGATMGIAVLAHPLERLLPGPRPLRVAAATSLAANIGVTPASLLVFGRSPLVSLVANLLAVPVAGFVMIVGIPAGLLAAAFPTLAPIVLLPGRLGTRWVLVVARLAAAVEPDGWGRWPAVIQLAAVATLVIVRRRRAGPLRRVRSPGSDP
ncbi:MAG: ComEC/Rec2 family competence protein [Acidimicrobiia bacterium]